MAHDTELSGPDLAAGIDVSELHESMPLLGHAHGEAILLVRKGAEILAVGAKCTHYGGPLAQGLVVGETIRCPWHHACFHLGTGDALAAPALDPIACYDVTRRGERLIVGARKSRAVRPQPPPKSPETIVLVGLAPPARPRPNDSVTWATRAPSR